MLGFSRGARWGIDLRIQHVGWFDGVVLLGAYVASKGGWQQEQEAFALMRANIPILMVHGLDDQCCRPKYLQWHLRFELAMQNPAGKNHGTRLVTFASLNLPGDHESMELLFRALDFDKLSDPQTDGFWRAMLQGRALQAVSACTVVSVAT